MQAVHRASQQACASWAVEQKAIFEVEVAQAEQRLVMQ